MDGFYFFALSTFAFTSQAKRSFLEEERSDGKGATQPHFSKEEK